MHTRRILQKIKQIIDALKLNLKGKIVLTEAATGAYVVTPIIAALAGAKVYAFTQNTKYGSIADVKEQTYNLLKEFSIDENQLIVIDELTPEIISKADIITNSGHLRSLNENKLKHTKQGVVIPLMFESWELRGADLDMAYCKSKNIKVGATNERHPDVDVFNYLGDMALKQIFDAGLNPYRNKFVLLCNNDFGPYIAKTLSKVCQKLCVIDKTINKEKYSSLQVDWGGDFDDMVIPEEYKDVAGLIFTAYPFDKMWIGTSEAEIPLEKILDQIENPYILRYAGDIDEEYCTGKIRFYPKIVQSGHMGILPSDIGYDPIIRLQAGGLKVGELMLKDMFKYKSDILVEKV